MSAQSADFIKTSGEYLFGIGEAQTLGQADEIAIGDLVKQISFTVFGDFTSVEREQTLGERFSSETAYESVIRSYSTATLTNAQRMTVSETDTSFTVMRYIRTSELDRIFDARRDKAIEFVSDAETALLKSRLDDALRYLYWGYILTQSLRYPNEAKFNGKLLVRYIPNRMEQILSNVKLSAAKDPSSNSDFVLYASYEGKPVESLDYTYFDGADYSGIYSIKDGRGIMEMRPPVVCKSTNVQIEYQFAGLAVTDREVADAMAAQRPARFKRATIQVQLDGKDEDGGELQERAGSMAVGSEYSDAVLDISESMRSGKAEELRDRFTEKGWNEFEKIRSYGRIRVAERKNLSCVALTGGKEVICRGLECNFAFSRGRNFNERLSFVFDVDGKVDGVALGIDRGLEMEIAGNRKWADQSKKTIISFLEGYRTAYALKDVGYVETVFDDDALIITGLTVRKAPRYNESKFLENSYVQVTRKSKAEYVAALRKSFASKEYVNLHFSDCQVSKLSPDVEKYSIQIRQDYYSSNYGDSGYLLLLVDLTNPKEPIIHVRVWQQHPDPKFGYIGPGLF